MGSRTAAAKILAKTQLFSGRHGDPRLDRGSLPFEQNGPKEDIDDLRVVVRICPL